MSTETKEPEETDWDRAMYVVRELEGRAWDTELEYARTWADSVEVDYDDGPCAIGFKKNDSTFWFLIDDTGCQWDADDPRSEMIEALIKERDLAIAHDRQPYPTAHAYESVCAALRREQDARADLRRELDQARSQHKSDQESAASALQTEAYEKGLLEQEAVKLRQERDEARAELVKAMRTIEAAANEDERMAELAVLVAAHPCTGRLAHDGPCPFHDQGPTDEQLLDEIKRRLREQPEQPGEVEEGGDRG